MPSDAVWIAMIGAGTTVGSLFIQQRQSRHNFNFMLQHQHKLVERQKLRSLISTYQGRMLEAANDWHRRMVQIYDGHYDDLHPKDQRLEPSQYYYQSLVFRFLQLMAISRRFEAEAFYIDARIAEAEDFDLLRFTKAFLWVMIHPEITPDDGQPGREHFRSDSFRPLLDLCYADNSVLSATNADATSNTDTGDTKPAPDPVDSGSRAPLTADGKLQLQEIRTKKGDLVFDRQRCITILRNGEQLGQGQEIRELLDFFDGVCPCEYRDDGHLRRRWDRLVALHLFVLAFIRRCGYPWQQRNLDVDAAASMLLYPNELANVFETWLPNLGLASSAMRDVTKSLARVAADTRGETDDEARSSRVLDRVQENREAAQVV